MTAAAWLAHAILAAVALAFAGVAVSGRVLGREAVAAAVEVLVRWATFAGFVAMLAAVAGAVVTVGEYWGLW